MPTLHYQCPSVNQIIVTECSWVLLLQISHIYMTNNDSNSLAKDWFNKAKRFDSYTAVLISGIIQHRGCHIYVHTYIRVMCASTCYITTPHQLVSCTGPSPWAGEMRCTFNSCHQWNLTASWNIVQDCHHIAQALSNSFQQYSRLMLLPLPTPFQGDRGGRQDYHLSIAVVSQPVSVHRIRNWCVQLLQHTSKRTYRERFKRV